MTIENIRLQHFRSYKDESFEFTPGVNIIVGPNASGKTNLLEAILVAATGKSYRAGDAELLQFNNNWARLEVHGETETRIVKLEASGSVRPRKSFVIDDKTYGRLSLQRILPVGFFEPNHLQLFTGSPEARRDFMDGLIEQTVTGYKRVARQYKRALTQRNALLKSGPQFGSSQLFAWNVRLSELGGQLAKERLILVERLNEGLSELYSELAHSPKSLRATYSSTCLAGDYSSQLLHKLEQNTELDYVRGFTSYGPHRDDLIVTIGDRSLQIAASRGETRTAVLALKIRELKLMEDMRGKTPLLLLDDVFSELDGARRQALTRFLSTYQIFITTTDADVVVQHFMHDCNIIPLEQP